jgi:hypothetical protein
MGGQSCMLCTTAATNYIPFSSTPAPILDGKQRVIGICAGHPDDTSWEKTKVDAAAAMKDARKNCRFPKGAKSHRRGLFPALAVGASFGGGQEVRPTYLKRIISNTRTQGPWQPSQQRHQCRYFVLTSQQYCLYPHRRICIG